MPRTAAASIVLAVAMMVAAIAPLWAAGPTATVGGVEAVNVRRGPGPETPAFTMLRKGSKVTVESMSGVWAFVELADGQRGYINSAFLTLPPGASVPTAAGESTPAATVAVDQTTPMETTAVETAAPLTDTPAMPVDTPVTGQMEQRLEQALDRIRALESARGDPTVAAGLAAEPHPHTPLPLGIEPPPPPEEFGDFRDIAPSLALAGVGFVVGFLLGVAYGQRQERHRRGRVRF